MSGLSRPIRQRGRRGSSRNPNHGLHGSRVVRPFFWSEPGPRQWFSRNTNHGFYAFHESRNTSHETRLFSHGWRHRKPPSGPLRPPASHCFPVHRCSPLFTIVRHCSRLFAIVRQKYCLEPVSLRRPVAASLGAFARHGAAIARHARGEWGVSRCPCPVSRSRSALRRASTSGLLPMPRTQYEPMLRKGNVLACISYHVARRSA